MLKCLLIDDDVDDQDVFKIAVSSINVPVQTLIAGSGSEAFQLLNSSNEFPNCIFLDLNMPRMNGREFIKKIKSMDMLKDIPVIIYSTSADPKDKTDLKFLGASQFITKPNSIEELSVILKREFSKVTSFGTIS